MKPTPMTADTAKPDEHPLGPLVQYVPMSQPIVSRLYAAGLAVGAGILLITAANLTPSEKLMGTHQQLKLPPCGFLVMTGFPCPTCGMTTAYAHTVRGHLIGALRSQIAGFLLALATVGVGLVSITGLFTGRRPEINWYRINPIHLVWWLGALLIVAWAAKILIGLANGTLPAR